MPDILDNLELTISLKTPDYEERYIFVRPDKIRDIWSTDKGFLGDILRNLASKKWGEDIE